MEHEEALEVIEAVRAMVGLRPLPQEPPDVFGGGTKVTLDGATFKTVRDWADELKCSRQAVSQRLATIERRLIGGHPDPYLFVKVGGVAQCKPSKQVRHRRRQRSKLLALHGGL